MRTIPRTRRSLGGAAPAALAVAVALLGLGLAATASASTAYGTLNNFDCVNDTGVEAHGFEIELDDVHSTDVTYTYDYNHYGVPRITEDGSDPLHPRVFVRYAATRDAAGTWSAYTAIPSGPISPTDGHQFTNPAVNFGGEHFGVGYYGAPSAVKYNWLIDDGAGNLVHGPAVYVATPTFVYYPPAPALAQPAQAQAVIVPPPPEVPPAKAWGEATWVKAIKTTTHNANKVELVELVDPDPNDPAAPDWTNGEPSEVEVEWRLLQTEFANPDNAKGELVAAPEDLPGGDEVVTRRYEFYKYTGPLDAETGEAMADAVGADGVHGTGTATYANAFDPLTGEWTTVTTDFSTVEVVGDFIGAQMSAFDVAPVLGLIDHVPDGERNVRYADRTVVVAAGAPFFAAVSGGSLPDGTSFDPILGVFSGTPTVAGTFTFTVDAQAVDGAVVSKTYTVTITDGGAVGSSTITAIAVPAAGGTVAGAGVYPTGSQVTLTATASPGFAFVDWTEGGAEVGVSAAIPITVGSDRTLVANFVALRTIATSASPVAGGATSGGGTFRDGDPVTVAATANAGFVFTGWTEGGAPVASTAAYSFTASADRALVATFAPTFTVATSASPSSAGSTSGGGTFASGGSVVVTATANPGYVFVAWTEGGAVVASTSTYTFAASADRTLVATFLPDAPVLSIASVGATRTGSTVYVSLVVQNGGGATAPSVTIDARKDATLAGKSPKEHPPLAVGDVAPGGTASSGLTFSGVKAGTQTFQVVLTYAGGTTTLSTQVVVP